MARPARRPRPNWRTVPLLLVALHPAVSFCTVPPTTTAWQTATRAPPITPTRNVATQQPRTTATMQAISSRAVYSSSRAGTTEVATLATRQHINGQEIDTGASGSVEGAASSSSSSDQPPSMRWKPPDVAGGIGVEKICSGLTRKGDTTAPLVARSLDSVRSSLIRQEETIIFSLIEREQFRQNSAIYMERTFRLNRLNVSDLYGRDASFLEYMLCETEKLHARGVCLACVRVHAWPVSNCCLLVVYDIDQCNSYDYSRAYDERLVGYRTCAQNVA